MFRDLVIRKYSKLEFFFLPKKILCFHNETIDELNTHIEDGVRRYNLLKQELSDKKNTSFMLSQQIEIYEKDKVKNLDTLDRSLVIAQELDFSKKELEAAHASLTKDLEHREVTSKLVKCELLKLREDHDQLQVIHNELFALSWETFHCLRTVIYSFILEVCIYHSGCFFFMVKCAS
jgi:hypothetical protein